MENSKKMYTGKPCPECGGRIPYLVDRRKYVYRIGTVYYCCYTCWRSAKKRVEARLEEENKNFSKNLP